MSIDALAMMFAHELARCSPCVKRKVGCVVLTDRGQYLKGSFNHVGEDCQCVNVRGVKNQHVRHAEADVIEYLQGLGVNMTGFVAYVTHPPCIECAKLLYSAGFARVVCTGTSTTSDGVDFLIDKRVKVDKK